MARSSYVYVAVSPEGYPSCTATVKYEFKIWLDKLPPEARGKFSLWRCADGTFGAEGYNGHRRSRLTLADFGL